jgi:hypothetical protein
VVKRLSRLVDELGMAFDSNVHFEGIAFQETALGIEKSVLDANGYTPEAYRDALIAILRNGANALPTSRVFWYANYLPRGNAYLYDVAEAVAPHHVAVGGPDVLPDSSPLQKFVYPLLRAQSEDVIVFNSAQNDSYRHDHVDNTAVTKYWTPLEIFDYARDDLRVRYLFWNRVTKPDPADSYTIEDAYPLMAGEPLGGVSSGIPSKPPIVHP